MNKIIIALVFFAVSLSSSYADSNITVEKAAQNTPDGWTAVSLPLIATITSTNTINITTYGADISSKDNTLAIQNALDAVPTTGGMVIIPAGTWLCGPITIKANTVLHICKGATLQLLPYGNGEDGKTASPANTYPTNGTNSNGLFNYKVFMTNASKASNIIIEGEGDESIIYGQGENWWDKRNYLGTRPGLIRFTSGSNFLFRNFKLQNSPGVNLTLGQSGKASNFTVHDVTIYAPSSVCSNPSHNTDGIPMWGPYINIYNCNISTGDDNIVADTNTQYCHAWNLTFGTGHGASFGSYTEKVHDIIYEGITFNNTETGFRIKTSRGRSGNDYDGTNSNGSVHNIILRNSTMTGVLQPIVLTTMYDSDKADPSTISPVDNTYQTPEYKDILFQNIKSTGTAYNSNFKYGNAVYIYGLPESYIHDITFDNVQISAQKGIFAAYCKDIKFINGSTITNIKDGTLYSKEYKSDIIWQTSGTEQLKLNEAKNANDSIYNLLGQQITDVSHGIVIKRGHKYLNK